MAAQADAHPVRLVVDDDLERTRLTVFLRLLLAIPHFIVLTVWAILFSLVGILSWFATLFAGCMPEGMHDFQAGYLRYMTRVSAYLFLIADPFPPFGATGSYPVELELAAPQQQSRWKTAFRIILAIPALILANVLQNVMQVVAFIGWFAALATGRMPQGMRDFQAYGLRYTMQTYGYAFLLTERYPTLAGGPGA